MTDESKLVVAVKAAIDRIPQRLQRTLIVATVIYFAGFVAVFTKGFIFRLLIPFQWQVFFEERSIVATFTGRWFLYGTSVLGLIMNWLVLLALIAGAYYAHRFLNQNKK